MKFDYTFLFVYASVLFGSPPTSKFDSPFTLIATTDKKSEILVIILDTRNVIPSINFIALIELRGRVT